MNNEQDTITEETITPSKNLNLSVLILFLSILIVLILGSIGILSNAAFKFSINKQRASEQISELQITIEELQQKASELAQATVESAQIQEHLNALRVEKTMEENELARKREVNTTYLKEITALQEQIKNIASDIEAQKNI